MSDVPFLLGQLQAAVERAKADRKAASEGSDACKACPFPDQTAALELVRLREGIGRLAEEIDEDHYPIEGFYAESICGECSNDRTEVFWPCRDAKRAERLRALLDDNEGERG